ncbi:hypothetical protein BpHYR1_047628, partial [Brachionus plicatilis]
MDNFTVAVASENGHVKLFSQTQEIYKMIAKNKNISSLESFGRHFLAAGTTDGNIYVRLED